jgi:hypothetical protein
MAAGPLRVEQRGTDWQLVGASVGTFGLINEFLGYLADRAYSPQTVRAYAFDLLAFARWLLEERIALEEITTDVLLRFLAACRTALAAGPPRRQRVLNLGRPQFRLRCHHGQSTIGGNLRPVCVSSHAPPGASQPRPTWA